MSRNEKAGGALGPPASPLDAAPYFFSLARHSASDLRPKLFQPSCEQSAAILGVLSLGEAEPMPVPALLPLVLEVSLEPDVEGLALGAGELPGLDAPGL